jgi:16S rRNA (guanine(966)-N(2))-methyltransferase RsmD
MRIVGGEYKGRRVSVPSNFPSRPTTDFAKEGLFNVLENQININDTSILDLCSGTGNIALEFLSRGSTFITCVDIHTNCLKFVQRNAASMGAEKRIRTMKLDILTFLQRNKQEFDLVFADPPYDYSNYETLIQLVMENKAVCKDGFFILEHSKQKDFSMQPNFQFFRNYGNVSFSFFKREI